LTALERSGGRRSAPSYERRVHPARQRRVPGDRDESRSLPAFPFSTFDPFHPDKNILPQVGRFFDQPARRHLLRALLGELEKLGPPPASNEVWQNVLKARHGALANETQQIKTALADNAPAFVRAVYKSAGDYNRLVFTSAVFGVQSCTFS
jgi:hypothetical protein